MKNPLGCLIQCFKDLVKFNMNLNVYYYAQFKVSPGNEKVIATCSYTQIKKFPKFGIIIYPKIITNQKVNIKYKVTH